jgi:hypothetical protein
VCSVRLRYFADVSVFGVDDTVLHVAEVQLFTRFGQQVPNSHLTPSSSSVYENYMPQLATDGKEGTFSSTASRNNDPTKAPYLDIKYPCR